MRIFKFCFSLIICLFISNAAFAQSKDNSNLKNDSLLKDITDIKKRLKSISHRNTETGFSAPVRIDTVYANSLNHENFRPLRDDKGLLIFEHSWLPFDDNVTFKDTIVYDPAFLPVVFDGKILPDDFNFLSSDKQGEFQLIPKESTFAPDLDRAQHVQNMRKFYYTNNPLKIRLNAFNFVAPEVLKEASVVEKKSVFEDLLTTDDAISISKPEVQKIQIKPVFWIKTGDHKLQLSYNKYSKQWSGDNSFDLLSHQKFTFNYKKDKIKFDNLVEWRLLVKQITSLDESSNNANGNKGRLNIIDDYLRSYSIFKVDAYRKWSYAANLEMKTPVFTKRAQDADRKYQRAFLTPFELNTGIGMSYSTEIQSKKDKHRKFKFSTDLSVLSVNYRYARNDSVPVTDFGIEAGKKSLTELGSTFNINISYSHNRFTKFTSRIKYFTNYDRVYAECENSFDFALNRFFSTTFYFYLKYDDGVSQSKKNNDDTWGYFNYNQMIRFGLSYTW